MPCRVEGPLLLFRFAACAPVMAGAGASSSAPISHVIVFSKSGTAAR